MSSAPAFFRWWRLLGLRHSTMMFGWCSPLQRLRRAMQNPRLTGPYCGSFHSRPRGNLSPRQRDRDTLGAMRITKFTHSCVRVEKHGSVLVLDPGNFSSPEEIREALEGAEYLMVTHEHPDHYFREPVHEVLNDHTDIQVYATQSAADELRESVKNPERIHSVQGEEEFDVGPFGIRTFGGQHALIHPLIPTIQNVGFMIDDDVYHPGDSLIVPHHITVKHLLLPIHAPWNKLQEVVDFLASVRPQRAFPIHDGLMAENGHAMLTKHLENFGTKYGSEYVRLRPGDSLNLEETS